ncbi:PorP/SprF family type IX secretion system membrane protein [Bacteroidales bacterium OttesenSCG-928-B11]|nr:PorP/SprF family type IX secretion system membrane protein [Bacteroidales bacterium OttesenSCG-928-B11]
MKQPLAEILRPKTLDEYVGQSHLMGEGAILRQAIENDNLHSMIFWGPPGVGKTTLALLMAKLTGADFYMLSAISSGVKDIRDVFEKAEKSVNKALLFIDEIHRFNKSQQDSLLGAVERGLVTLIGATTENPSFEVISPLLSRCQVYILKNLDQQELEQIIENSRKYLEDTLGFAIDIAEKEALIRVSSGDARKMINAIELVVSMMKPENGKILITNEVVMKIIQKNLVIYDKKGENHYDIISAFIKSIRGSDPNAAVYWLARMLVAGEDPLFIARRMIILASEDIGNANPNALLLANNCFQAVHQIGMPEARIILSQTAIYLASSPKSNASYLAIDEAIAWVNKTGNLPVPLHIRNAPTKLMKDIGYGKNYQYAHSYENNFVEQEFLPESISGKKFYEPQNNPRENDLRRYLKGLWKDKYKYIILLIIAFSFTKISNSQDFHYSQFYASPVSLNPATTGAYDGICRGGIHYRSQWMAVTTPFTTFSAFADMPVYKNNKRRELIGMGLTFMTDKAGDSKFRALNGSLSLSYVKALDPKNRFKLGLGAYGSVVQRSIYYAELYFDEQFQNYYFDPRNPVTEIFENDAFVFFDWGAGAFFSFTPDRTQTYSVGYSISHLNKARQNLLAAEHRLSMKSMIYFTGKIGLTREWNLQPAFYTALQGKFKELNFGTNVEYVFIEKNYKTVASVGGGVFYRWKDAVIANIMVDWQNFKFIFSYDVNVSDFTLATNSRGGFEFSIVYTHRKRTMPKAGKLPCPYEIM